MQGLNQEIQSARKRPLLLIELLATVGFDSNFTRDMLHMSQTSGPRVLHTCALQWSS